MTKEELREGKNKCHPYNHTHMTRAEIKICKKNYVKLSIKDFVWYVRVTRVKTTPEDHKVSWKNRKKTKQKFSYYSEDEIKFIIIKNRFSKNCPA